MANVTLDALAIHAFVQEITDVIEDVTLACISDTDRNIVWSQVFHNSGLHPEHCLPSKETPLKSASYAPIREGDTAYHFPLPCDNIEGCIFSLTINSPSPPNLASVNFGIGSILVCLARQLDLDYTLSTTKLAAPISKPIGRVEQLLDSLPANDNLEQALQLLVSACRDEHNFDGLVIAVPSHQISVIADSPRFSKGLAGRLLAKLAKHMAQNKKLISAQITLVDGSDAHLIGAPIGQDQDTAPGIVYMVSSAETQAYTSLVLSIANQIATIAPAASSNLTLLSRFELVAKIEDSFQRQSSLPSSLVYFDVDKMHAINDAFGYSGGDRALSIFRRTLSDCVGANDIIAQLGGDRFAVFMPGASGETAVTKAEDVLRLLSQESIDDSSKSIRLSASAGIVDNVAATKGAEDLLILAEVASRGAQDRGGNQCALFRDIDSSIIQRRSDVDKVGFLQMALIENQFVLHAQRIQALGDEGGQKFELLARLKGHGAPDRSPAEYLSAAERYKLMSAIDRWVINSALSNIAEADNPLEVALTTFGINVSAQSLQDESFVEFIETRISETGVSPDSLCFELTETSLVRNIDRAQRFVHKLQRLGCQVALDDFGTGYSSFAYLKTLPVDYLKIDGAFVRDILESDLSKAIVNSVVMIADVIGARTVAEHVENPMVQAWLKKAGVHYVQGYVVHKPEPLSDVLASMGSLDGILDVTTSIDLRQLSNSDRALPEPG